MFLKRKYPVVRQYDQIDCAPAALLSVLRYYGGDDNLVHVRELCHTNTHGSTMYSLKEAATALGFTARGAQSEYEDLLTEKMPCIAHVVLENRLQHFIVIYRIDEKGILAGDSAKGLVKISRKAFLDIWRYKAVVLLEVNSNIYKGANPKWHHWIINHIKEETNWFFQSFFLGVIYTALGLLTAFFIQLLIDKFIPGSNYTKILYTAIFLLMLLVVRALCGYLRQRFSVELNKRISININRGFISHLFKLPKRFFDTRKTGDITARIHDAIRIQQAILLISGTTIIDGLIIGGSFIFIFYFSEILAWLALAVVPIYGLILWFNSRKLKQQQNEVMKHYALVESTYIDSLSGIDEVFNFNSTLFFSQLNQTIFGYYQRQIEILGITRSKLNFFSELSGTFITIGMLFLGAFFVISGQLLLGQMMAAYSLLANMLPSVNRLVDAYISLQGATIASRRLLDMLLVKKEANNGKLPFKLKQALCIENGSFAWPGNKNLLSAINLKLKKGEIAALWGKSGSGKSTLVQLIQRKYNFQSGQIYIDNTPADAIDLASFRKKVALVPQDIRIFNGTLAENIICGRNHLDLNTLSSQIRLLGLASFLSDFTQGLMTLVGEDNLQLSGGEKQILGLIRALLDQPEILIIDEGLNAIDIEIESQIFNIIRNYAKNHLVLIISHNLNTILKADTIHILSDGRIIQSGPIGVLISREGYFKQMWHKYRQNNGKERAFA